MHYYANSRRYSEMTYRPCGRSGLRLPALSLGLWHNFGDTTPLERQREILRTAFDLGITHFDLANNYGSPPGSAESNFGRLLREDFKAYRDELIISTKAGWEMWAGPYGEGGGSRKYMLASLDQSLRRMGLDYVDIFYSHRFDIDTSLEETASALAAAVQHGKALYVGISSYSAGKTREIAALLREWKIRCLIHQPSYNLLNRWIEGSLLGVLEKEGIGCIAFTPLAQGLLTGKYLNGVPEDSRVRQSGGDSLRQSHLSQENLSRIRTLNEIAKARGQSLAQMALAWILRDPRVTSALIGASKPSQVTENVAALKNIDFSADELAAIEAYAQEGGVNLWERPAQDLRP
jgi:L-glyceraldehyde 3-phosphate reductase